MKIALFLVGYGHVARRFVELLRESGPALSALGVEPVVVAAASRRLGIAFDPNGLDLAAFDRGPARQPSDESAIRNALGQMGFFPARVLIETTTLNIDSGEPAISHIRAALASGAHAITANKGPVAFAYRALSDQAAQADRAFLFEGAVMDGVPVFGLVRETMPAVRIRGFRGVVNSTTNFMLTAMERGEAYDAALRRMQEAGVAEADPALDVEGWDAAAKTAALANVLLDARTTPGAMPREGIGPSTGARAVAALERGHRLKLVAHGSGQGSSAELGVRLEELDADDPLAVLDGQANALELDTWPLGRIVITQRDGGLEKTAYALLTDLVTVARRLQSPAGSMDRSAR